MSLSRRVFLAAFAIAACLALPSQESSATSRPRKQVALAKKEAMATFKEKHGQVIRLVKRKASSKTIERKVDQLLDYEWLAQSALGGPKRFEKRCYPKCADFQELLTRLIRENYLKRIRLSDRGKVEYVGEDKRARASKVTTRVSFTKNGRQQVIEVAYVMHKVDGAWQVRDIITDGVSLARNYKYEFNKVLRDGGIDELMRRLEDKLKTLAKTPALKSSRTKPGK
jgi:phospholipid transport system substrate-binding protein